MTQEDTDAMIAQALWASENPYYDYDMFGGGYDSDSDDGKRKRKAQIKKGRKRSNTGSAQDGVVAIAVAAPGAAALGDTQGHPTDSTSGEPGGQNLECELTESGRRKRKDTGKPREKGRPWTVEEEAKFLEGLETFGRDWKAIGSFMGSRDHRAVASHAQKHFIKLCLSGQELPSKVAESGLGYTLSGKLLDPNSSAARAYGFRPELVQKLAGTALATAMRGIQQEQLQGSRAEEGAAAADGSAGSKDQDAAAAAASGKPPASKRQRRPPANTSNAGTSSSAGTGANGSGNVPLLAVPLPTLATDLAGEAGAAGAGGGEGASGGYQQTEYARNRPRREVVQQKVMLGHTSESLDLMKCCEYMGPPGSGAPLAQPFAVEVTSQVMVTMEFHAHLSCYEVIGLLGGTWDAAARKITVSEAFPCRRAAGSDARTSVELDPEAEVEARAAMEDKGMRCVGWYHSHPVFEPLPSQKDMENQRNYQALTRDEGSGLEPFLGFIMGPYDLAMPQPLTAVTAFVVQHKAGLLQPYSLRYGMVDSKSLPSPTTCAKLTQLLAMFKDDIGRIDFSETWRPFTSLGPAGQLLGPPCSKLQKLTTALRYQLSHVGDKPALEEWLVTVGEEIQESWNVPLGIGQASPSAEAAAGSAEEQKTGGTPAPRDEQMTEAAVESTPAAEAAGEASALAAQRENGDAAAATAGGALPQPAEDEGHPGEAVAADEGQSETPSAEAARPGGDGLSDGAAAELGAEAEVGGGGDSSKVLGENKNGSNTVARSAAAAGGTAETKEKAAAGKPAAKPAGEAAG